MAEHISSFLLHVRRQAVDNTAPSSPDVTGGPTDSATATAASAAGTGMDVTTDATPLAVADDAHASSASVDIGAVATSSATAARKRKGRGKGNHVARDERKRQRRAAFLLTTQADTEAGT